MSAPAFLNKPKHKDNVIATPRGWVVEKTGELLVSVKNLDQRIAEHLGLPTFKFAAPDIWQEPHTGPAAEIVTLPHTGEPAQIALLSADTAITALLDSLSDAPVSEAVVAPVVVPEVKEIPEAPVVVKKKLGRPPKIRPVEGEVVAPAPVAKVEDKPAEEPVVAETAVMEA